MSKITSIELAGKYGNPSKEKHYEGGGFDPTSGPLCSYTSDGEPFTSSLNALLTLGVGIEVQENKDDPWVECTKYKHCRDGMGDLYAVRNKV